MIRTRQKEKWIVYTVAVLLCLVLVTFWLMCNVYAKYTAEGSGSDSARVAKFSVTDMGTLKDQINVSMAPGESESYKVTVTNNSEVAIEYVVDVNNVYKNLPLVFTLTDANGQKIATTDVSGQMIATTDATGQTVADADGQPTVSNSNEISAGGLRVAANSAEIAADDHSEHTYTLTINWPKENNGSQNPEYAGKTDLIEITLNAVQID